MDSKTTDSERATKKQKTPTGNGADVTEQVINDLEARSVVGKKKYGTVLRTNNGRDALTDLYQELLDACCYMRQELMERKANETSGEAGREASDLIGELASTPAWKDVDEALPNEDCKVDVWMPEYDGDYKRVTDVNFSFETKEFYIDYDLIDVTEDVKYWKKRPQPPSDKT